MQYTWEGKCAFEMASIPKAAAQQLRLASAPQLRVLLWLCCVGGGRFDASACAVACGLTYDTCEEAMRYWQDAGLIRLDEEPVVKTPTPAVIVPPPEPISVPPVQEADVPAVDVTVAPTPVGNDRPSREQVLSTCASDERFAFLLETASAKLGKMLSPADMSVYLYLYRDLALPPEVILMIIGYAVKNGKAKLAYIEKTAIGWVEDGITTIAAADEHLCRLERNEQAWTQLSEWLDTGIARPTVAQKTAVSRWIYEWSMTREVILAVLTYTIERNGKLQIPYADKILERFHAEGIVTEQAAKEALSPQKKSPKASKSRMKTASDRPPSFDLGKHEEMALRHRPQPPKYTKR